MRVFKGLEELPPLKKAVVTVGSFDGVHCGHRAIIDRLKALARETGGETVLVTFWPHPRKVLDPDTTHFRLLNSLREKEYLLEQAGIDNLVVIPFTREFSRTSSRSFAGDILHGKLKAETVVVGYNHHFGRDRRGDFDSLRAAGREKGFRVCEIPKQDVDHEKISSTVIRETLHRGDVRTAARYLGFPYFFLGRTDDEGWLQTDESLKLVPPAGRYRVRLGAGGDAPLSTATIGERGIFLPEAPAGDAFVAFLDRL